ncbi:MAG: GGDEF domain-containing protein [Myxococcales bacterium]|nr:GGDEF domain-containing protein [Myxococcales bacterium]MCB9755719.1 GGDEF domain-containing protein [Myxococcales bacterium]
MTADVSTRTRAAPVRPREPADGCLLVIYPPDGPYYGHRLQLDGTLTIGRDQRNSLVLDADCVSRRHCQIEPAGANEWVVVDHDSKNGTYLDNASIRRAPLRSGCQLRVGDTILKFLAGDAIELQFIEAAYRMAVEDPLTGLPNRRAFDQALARDLARARRSRASLCVALFDVDRFKRINDDYGHVAGDTVLRELAVAVTPRVRSGDVFARYGGEEFALLLPETSLRNAVASCDRIRRLIAKRGVSTRKGVVPVTVSVGVAEFELSMDAEELLAAADRQLYAAKEGGRDQVQPRPTDA